MTKDTYTIKELESICGVKSHTIRVWETRFSLLNPERTQTNIRIYSQENLRRLMQIVSLINSGYKISKISEYTGDELDEICRTEMLKSVESSTYVMEMLLRVLDKDTEGFDQLYNHFLERFLHEEFILEILEPLVEKIRNLWMIRSIEPYYEEYTLNRIFTNTILAAEKERKNGRCSKQILIFQSDKQSFPVRLSLVYFLAAVKNYKIHFFMYPLSTSSLNAMKHKFEPDIVYTEFNDNIKESTLIKYCCLLEEAFPAAKNIISGSKIAKYWKIIPNKVYAIRNLEVLSKSL